MRLAGAMGQLALVLFVLERFVSPSLAGLTVFLSVAPGIAMSPLAGVLLDRYGRVRLMVADYAISALALGGVVVLAASGALSLVPLLVLVTVASLLNPLGATGGRSLFPLVVPRPLWDRANAVDSLGYTLTSLVGPPVAGVIVALASAQIAIAATACVFLAGALAFVAMPPLRDAASASGPLLVGARDALVYVIRHRSLRALAVGISVANLGQGILLVALPVLVFGRLGGGASLVGTLWAIVGGAGVLSGLVTGRAGSEGRERWLVAAGMAGVGLGCAVLVGATTLPMVVIGVVLLGLASGPMDIGLFSLRQRVTDPGWYGRAFAVSMHLNYAGVPVGSAISGPLLAVSTAFALSWAVAFCALAAVLTLVMLPRAGGLSSGRR